MKIYNKVYFKLEDCSEIILRPTDDWNEQNKTFIIEINADEDHNAYSYITIEEAEALVTQLKYYIDMVKN